MAGREEAPRTAGGARVSDVQAPINALDAARRAARAQPEDIDRLRIAAAGTDRGVMRERSRRTSPVLAAAAALVGIALAALVVYLVGSALVGVATYRDGAAAQEKEAAGDITEGVLSLTYGGRTYELVADGDAGALVRDSGSGDEPEVLANLSYAPVGMVRHGSMVYAVSSSNASYEVVARDLGNGGIASVIAEGEGHVQTIELQSNSLLLVFDSGESTTIPLSE